MTPSPPLPPEVWDALPVEARALIQAMQLQIAALQAEVRSLKDRLDSNSRNSSRPPSSDPIHLKRQPPTTPSGKKRGGQPGHKRATRPLVPPEQLADTITCKPAACSGCGAPSTAPTPSRSAIRSPRSRPIRPVVIEYQLHRLTCPGCGVTTRGPLPEGVPAGSFGPRLRAMLSLLAAEFRLAKRPCNAWPGPCWAWTSRLGMVAKLERQTAIVLGPVDAELAEAVRSAPASHIDETPWRQANRKAWLWVGTGDAGDALPDRPGPQGRDGPGDPGRRPREGGHLRPVQCLWLGHQEAMVLGASAAGLPGDDRPGRRRLGGRVEALEAVRRPVLGLAPGGRGRAELGRLPAVGRVDPGASRRGVGPGCVVPERPDGGDVPPPAGTASAHSFAAWVVWRDRDPARYLGIGPRHRIAARLGSACGDRRVTDPEISAMAKLVDVASIASYFESLDDPRHTRNRKHLLVDIAVIAVCAILCGCDGPPPSIAGPSTATPGWLNTSPCPTASPHATASVALSSCSNPKPSNAAFWPGSATQSWPRRRPSSRSARGHRRQVLSRLARPGQGLGALHIVSAWATEQGIALGQVATRGQVQRDHRHPATSEADRLEGGPDHDRCDGLPEGDRPAGRHRGRRLCDRREGQPAEARRGDPDVLDRSPGGRPEEVQAPVARDARGRSTAASTSGRTIWRRCPGTSPAGRTGPGSRRSAARSG